MLNDGSEEAELQESNVFEVQHLRKVLKGCREALELAGKLLRYNAISDQGELLDRHKVYDAIRKAKEK